MAWTKYGSQGAAVQCRRNAAKIADREALTPKPEHQAGFINQDPCKPAWELPM